jgi:hypothetical protein
MADLGSKATDGRLSFIKYVTENKRFSEIEYEIEKGKSTHIYTKKDTNLVAGSKEFKAGTKIKITDTKLYEISNMKLALVQIGGSKGFIPINMIRKPTGGNGTQYEDEVVDAINSYILEAGGTVDFKLKGDSKVYKDISYAVKVDSPIKSRAGVKGDPKADIILCKDVKNPTAAGSIYISHKKEGGPEAFQQYGGLSEQSGEHIYNHPLVQKFLGEVAKVLGDSDQLPTPILGEFKDDTLSNMSIYGPDYGKAFSLQHTQLIGQGKPVFKNTGKTTELDFSSHMSLSGDLSHFTGGYLPVFGATFRAGRGFTYKGNRYNGARVAIYPYKLMATRGGLVIVKVKK